MSTGKCSSSGVATTTVTTLLRIGSIQELGSGSTVQKEEVVRSIKNLVF